MPASEFDSETLTLINIDMHKNHRAWTQIHGPNTSSFLLEVEAAFEHNAFLDTQPRGLPLTEKMAHRVSRSLLIPSNHTSSLQQLLLSGTSHCLNCFEIRLAVKT